MYLKSIEVHGFKSFANKINFQFHNGITGIVGPNGSGKSNVADAVRWVLGEQRIKQLRGASMQDVIFSGTENRKPIGYAYVAITLDNSDHQLAVDYEEVKIARRIYRSGESEYLLNGNICRLKDVNELFYDTGIGKEGYSIIGQGQIDKILSGKPEERRELFDEAAGIVKFKRRKATAQKKLEDEKQNLLRVTDILSELEKQVGPLEKQAETAKSYLKMKDSLKFYDVNKFLLENEKVKTQLDDVQIKYKIASDDYTISSNTYERIKEEYSEIEHTLETLEVEIEGARSSLTDTSLMRGRLEGEINVLKEQIKAIGENQVHLNTRVSHINTQLNGKKEEQAQVLIEKSQVDKQLEEVLVRREDVKKILLEIQNKIELNNAFIEEHKNKIIETLNERANIQAKIARNDSVMEQDAIRNAGLDAKLLSVKSNEEQQEEVIRQLEAEFESINEMISICHTRQKNIENRLQEIKQALTNVDVTYQEKKELYHAQKSKLETISNLNERYEGYGNSIKRVMEQKQEHKGLVGVVADIIKVEQTYEVAIETALGGNIQNIVTDDEETAKKMIAYLKKHKFGRATFLPLTSIQNPKVLKADEVLTEQGVIGMADQLVKIDQKYGNVAKAMLGRIVVVDTMSHALEIARKYKYTIRMVTLEGELLVPGGAISGGAFKNASNLLSRKRELEELEGQVQKTQKDLEEIQCSIDELKEERGGLRLEVEEAKRELQKQFIAQNTTRVNLGKERERQNEVQEGYKDLEQERKELADKLIIGKRTKEENLQELSLSEKLEKQLELEILEKQTVLENERVEESKQSASVAEQDVLVETITQKQGFQQENLERIQGEMEVFLEELEETNHALELSKENLAYKEDSIVKIEETVLASNTSQSDIEVTLAQNMGKKEELLLKQKQFFARREEMASQIAGLDKEVYRLNAGREKLEEAITSQINYMWDEYEITLSDAATLRDESMTDLTMMKREVSSLREQIKGLGPVNVNAIEDYKNVVERYDFLKSQHDDLIEAEAVLIRIVEELDASMRKQFNEKFHEIAKEFDHVFKELFGGGKGTLELMEDEDVLEAGVKIIAQPPGKKLQNMMQLSGGEKALAAIALLFAIQNLKPSPFCLLDEIEAALDESNVERFAKYLGKLTKHTQFIVITHRRGTMEKADRLYGITMQEKGVSALVSVNLIEKELEEQG